MMHSYDMTARLSKRSAPSPNQADMTRFSGRRPEIMAIKATFELEASELLLGNGPVVGIDEAGRGPWAGPVVAAAVLLDPDNIPMGIADSKALDAEDRAILYPKILASSRVGVGIAPVERIDRDNILNATMWAMTEALKLLMTTVGPMPRLALIDGNKAPRLTIPTRTVIKGDAKCLSIAAASIVAKVTRDRMMIDLAGHFPGYGFEKHKGYGTAEHNAAIQTLGVCAAHRRSFKPIQLALLPG
jgi:ribonuclease HII